MKLAELKRRMQVGTRLRLVNSLMGPCDKLRVVDGYDSVDVWFTGDNIKEGKVSHLRWPKASELRETPGGFEIVEDGEVSAAYVWVVDPGPVDITVEDLGGDLASLVPATDKARGWLRDQGFTGEPRPDGGFLAEHEALGGLEREARAAGFSVAMPDRVKKAVDAGEAILQRGLALARQGPDFEVTYVAPLYCVQPLTGKALTWLGENLTAEQTWLGGGLMVESDRVTDLVIAMRDAGLVQKGELTP